MVCRMEPGYRKAKAEKNPGMVSAADTASICEGKSEQEETEDVIWG